MKNVVGRMIIGVSVGLFAISPSARAQVRVAPVTSATDNAGNPLAEARMVRSSESNDSGWVGLVSVAKATYPQQWIACTSDAFCATAVSSKAVSAGGGACDLNGDGVVNVADVQLAVDIELGALNCPADLDGGMCGSLVQQVLNASLGAVCTATISHSVTLNWTAITSASIAGYNVYRSATSGGPYTRLNSSLITATSFVDTTVAPGEAYYYVATAVNTSDLESAYSNQAAATVPSE